MCEVPHLPTISRRSQDTRLLNYSSLEQMKPTSRRGGKIKYAERGGATMDIFFIEVGLSIVSTNQSQICRRPRNFCRVLHQFYASCPYLYPKDHFGHTMHITHNKNTTGEIMQKWNHEDREVNTPERRIAQGGTQNMQDARLSSNTRVWTDLKS